ncbi:hypothetical protein M0R45_030675 [Rubus argutus]|uniref:Ubinuclein 1 n=1 Tax=Rubus argutus TaxID=59490 RepID=A0AAW1WCK9_RUBAR
MVLFFCKFCRQSPSGSLILLLQPSLVWSLSATKKTTQSAKASSIQLPFQKPLEASLPPAHVSSCPSLVARELSSSFSPASAITTLQQAVSGSLFQPAHLHRDHPYLSSCNLAEIFLGF